LIDPWWGKIEFWLELL